MTRVVFMGTPEFAVPSLAAVAEIGAYEIVGVFTREDQPAGRGQRIVESPVKRYAVTHGWSVFQPRSLRAPDEQARLAALQPHVVVVAAYGLILPQTVLNIPLHGCVNVHGSLLPRHRGAAPIAAAILGGDEEAGVSIMLMDEGVDTGPVLSTAALAIAPDDTTGSLTARLAQLGAALLARTLPAWLNDAIAPQPQEEASATYAPRIEKETGRIDWREDAQVINRQVRAYQPWPSAYTYWDGRMLKVLRAEPDTSAADATTGALAGAPGTVVREGKRAGVITGRGVLWLEEVQLQGKKPLTLVAFLAGARGFVGSVLG